MAPTGRRPSAGRSSIGRASGYRRPRPRRRRRRSSRGLLQRAISLPLRLPHMRLPTPSPVQRDVLGLGLLALGVFMGFVLYGGWNGGRAGHGLAVAVGWLLGRTRGLVPLALCWGGATLVLGGVLPDLRPLRGGLVCVFAALTLALAAGTLGFSSGPVRGGSQWASASLQAHGGVVGQALYEVAHRLVQDVGVDILVVFLLLGGVLMLTGASLAGVLAAGGKGLSRAAGAARQRSSRGVHAHAGEQGGEFLADAALAPPEPSGAELVLRGRDAGEDSLEPAPGADSERAQGDLDAEQLRVWDEREPDEERVPGVTVASAEELTPRGRLREAVTGDPSFRWELPDASKLLVRSTGEQMRPDTGDQAHVAASLLEALGHFGVKAKVIGSVSGPHITSYELKLAPGTKVS